MSFQVFLLTHNKRNLKIQNSIYRKETKDSHKAIHFPHIYNIKTERASAFTSKGSMTLEAAVVVPIFFFAVLCLVFLLEMMAVQTTVRSAVYSAGRELAQQVYDKNLVTTQEMEQKVVKYMKTEALENNLLFGGTEEVSLENSKWNWGTGVLDLCVEYKIRIPLLLFRIPVVMQAETLRIKGWNGYAPGAVYSDEKKVVYMTETGLVYHSTPDCTYLDMSVSVVKKKDLRNLRNSSGAKYYSCETCGEKDNAQGDFYVTSHGTRYHTSLECKKIKRNVYAVPKDEVYGLGGCSKCVK